MNYSFDIKKFARGLIPLAVRKTKFLSWINVLVTPLLKLESDFENFRRDTDEESKWNGQTISLRTVLVQKFGPGITITNTNTPIAPLYMFSAKDRKNESFYGPTDSRNPAMHSPKAYDLDSVDFTVNVPNGILFDQDEMRAVIKAHKLYSKTFKIVIV
jgi:hypothetical protein